MIIEEVPTVSIKHREIVNAMRELADLIDAGEIVVTYSKIHKLYEIGDGTYFRLEVGARAEEKEPT